MNKSILFLFVFLPIILGYSLPSVFEIEEHTAYIEGIDTGIPCPSPEQIKNPVQTGEVNKLRPLIVQPNNNCERLQGVILSVGNDTALKNNVAIFYAEKAINTNLPANYNYCDLAEWIWYGQTDDERKRLKGLEHYVFPDYCYQEIPDFTIPEFGVVSAIILGGALAGIVAISLKSEIGIANH